MIGQKQLYIKGDQYCGDCLRACIASIFELPIKKVPHFVHEHGAYWEALRKWLHLRNVEYIRLEGHIHTADHCLYVGISPRGAPGRHAVVGQKGRIVFDPHPDNTGLTGLAELTFIFKPRKINWTRTGLFDAVKSGPDFDI